jgi:hypothetical protein
MTEPLILACARATERLLICLFGGLSLGWGWNLFRIGVVDPQAGELDLKSWRIKFQRVGPGVFFALFGAVILVTGLSRPLTETSRPQQRPIAQAADEKPTAAPDASIVYFQPDGAGRDAIKRVVRALNTFTILYEPKSSSKLDAERMRALIEAQRELEKFRNAVVTRQFGQRAVSLYLSRISVSASDPQSLSPE